MKMKNKLVLVALLTGISLPVFAQEAPSAPPVAPAEVVAAPAPAPAVAEAKPAAKPAVAPAKPAPSSAANDLFAKAQGNTPEKTNTVKSGESPYSESGWILFVGAGVIALAGWGATQWKRRQNDFSGNAIEQINSLALGPKHRVSVIEVDGKRLLIGMTDGHMSVLTDLGRAEPKEDKVAEAAWKDALSAARSRVFTDAPAEPARPSVANPPLTENSGMFQSFDRSPQPRQNRETDSVMIGLKALEQKARR